MCDHQPREEAMVVTHRDQSGKPTVWCDPCLEPLVRALNDSGMPTVASCCGHGLLPGNVVLADGRTLLLLPSWNEAQWATEDIIDGQRHRLMADEHIAERVRDCECPTNNVDCMHPTCPRFMPEKRQDAEDVADRYEALEIIVKARSDGKSWFDVIFEVCTDGCQGSETAPCTCGVESFGGMVGTLTQCYRWQGVEVDDPEQFDG